jgi:hypothetical protein
MAKDGAGLPEPVGGQTGEQGQAQEPQQPYRAQDPQRPQHRHHHDDQVGDVAGDEPAPVGSQVQLAGVLGGDQASVTVPLTVAA